MADRGGEGADVDGGRRPLLSMTLDVPSDGLRGWVVVDSLVAGVAMGGTRMTATVDEAEVRALARAMTVKLALVGLPVGGAKAGIVAPTRAERSARERLLAAYGRTIAPLLHGGVYLGCDQGTTHADRDSFFAAAGYEVAARPGVTPLPVTWAELWRHLGGITGFGVATAVSAGLGAGRPSAERRVAVQGFGTVGRSVARHLTDRGHRIVAVADVAGTVRCQHGLSVDDLVAVTDEAGTIDRRRLPTQVVADATPEAWLDVDADVLVLAAGGGAVHEGNVDRVRAPLVAEGGNLACTATAKEALAAAGVTVLPDVVVNVGAAAAAGCVLTGEAPALPLPNLVDWLHARVAADIERNTRDVLSLAEGGVADPVSVLLAERAPALATVP